MSQTEQKVQNTEQEEPQIGLPEQMFPALRPLEVFLEEVERIAPQCGATPENIRRFVEFLRIKYGKGLPESRWEK